MFNESRRKELATVTKVPLDVWFFGGRHNVSSLLLISAVSLCVCPEALLVDLTLPTFSQQSLDGVQLRLQTFLQIL